MIPISKQIINNSKSVHLNELHAFFAFIDYNQLYRYYTRNAGSG